MNDRAYSAKNRCWKLLIAFLTLLFLCTAFAYHAATAIPELTYLIIEDVDSSTVLSSYPVRDGSILVFSFIHSLYHGRQNEKYSVINQKLILKETFFSSYDMAIYYDEDPPGGIQTVESGYVVHSNKEIKNITFKLGTTVPHTLYLNEMAIDLYEMSAPGKTLQIYIGNLINHNLQ